MIVTRRKLRRLILETWLQTKWDAGDNVVTIQDVIGYLDQAKRAVTMIRAQKLREMLPKSSLDLAPERVASADIRHPLIVVVDSETNQLLYVLDGNHRLQRAVNIDTNISIRILYTHEFDALLG
tara:strand:- start:5096 stop:5467 length:372 start_codon:yes stop_codon:yes gene_type:complete